MGQRMRRIGALLLAALLLLFTGCAHKGQEEESTAPEPVQRGAMNPLTGLASLSESAVGKRPFAVMVNNAPPARPQWGLTSPDIVVEGLVEGGATRMLWLYADVNDIPEKIGSVRSARHDFVEIAMGFDAFFIHWGGSIYAYDTMYKQETDTLDGMAGTYFFRDNTRQVDIEHRGCTRGTLLARGVSDKGYRTDIGEKYASPFTFSQDAPRTLSGGACRKVTASFSNAASYTHTFRYREADRLYYNDIGGAPMNGDDGEQMAVSNVIILYTAVSSMGDNAGCIDMDLRAGTGVYISGGHYETIEWEKGAAPGDTLRLTTPGGEPLLLNPGKSWVGFVPKSREHRTVLSETDPDAI